ncbi:MAG TPA: transposase [Terriglobales bacterium]|nr:transposase [Terriglobales bacterium]
MPGHFYRRTLPHLQRDYKPHFITFCTQNRWVLPDGARSMVLDCCLHDHDIKFDLHVAVVMPDHAHLILTPLINTEAKRVYSLAEIMDAIKGVSSHRINHHLGRHGRIWQEESFDHVPRSSESLDEKIAYILNNPVRKGLVSQPEHYSWLWVKTMIAA